MASRVFITGISGFTGQALADELAINGYEVFGISQNPVSHPNGQVYTCDLLDEPRLRELLVLIKPSIIFHLAAISFVGHTSVNAIYETNFLGTLSLLRAVADANLDLQKMVVASSGNVYGSVELPLIDESVPCHPINDYGVSKLAMEYLVALWFDRLPLLIARPFNCIGKGQAENFLVPKIVKHFASKAKEIELGNINIIRDFIDIRTVADAYRKLAESPSTGEIINIASGVGHGLLDVFSTMETISGWKVDIKVNKDFVRTNEIVRLVGSNSKLLGLIGELRSYSFEDTLRTIYSDALQGGTGLSSS